MFRKLESLKQDLGDGVSAFAQRTQVFFLNPYTIQARFYFYIRIVNNETWFIRLEMIQTEVKLYYRNFCERL